MVWHIRPGRLSVPHQQHDTEVDLGEFTRLACSPCLPPCCSRWWRCGLTDRHRRLITVTVIAWIVEGTWPAWWTPPAPGRRKAPASSAARHRPDVPGAARGAYAGLLGRGRPERDPGTRLEHLAAASAGQLLAAAAERLGRPCTRLERSGRIEREVVAAAEGADLLILARDGDRTHLGPRSLSPASRFVVDHAPCPVLLVWPETRAGHRHHPAPPPPGPPHRR